MQTPKTLQEAYNNAQTIDLFKKSITHFRNLNTVVVDKFLSMKKLQSQSK